MPDFLFDIGKVLLDFNFETSLRKFLPATHPSPANALDQLLARKDEFEAGQISTEDYTRWALETLDSNVSAEVFHEAWCNIFTPNQPMWEMVRKLHSAGHRLILFSNTNAIHCPWIFDAFPQFSLFHGSILSYEVGAIKPQLEIYQHAIDKYSLVPENTLYIDDLPANIATGQQLGFQTHTYDLNNHQAFEHWLAKKLSFLKTEH